MIFFIKSAAKKIVGYSYLGQRDVLSLIPKIFQDITARLYIYRVDSLPEIDPFWTS